MRIIDQNGLLDVPYENTVIAIDDGDIIAHISGLNSSYMMASYSSTEIARQALKKLLIAYQRHENEIERAVGRLSEYFQFPPEEHL